MGCGDCGVFHDVRVLWVWVLGDVAVGVVACLGFVFGCLDVDDLGVFEFLSWVSDYYEHFRVLRFVVVSFPVFPYLLQEGWGC